MLKLFMAIVAVMGSLWGASIQDDEQFKAAVAQFDDQKRTVLMIYTTDECPECAYMKQKVFHDPAIESFMKHRFVVIEKNVHKDPLPDGYDYFGIPTMFFIDKGGKKKETIVGSQRPQPFLKALRRIEGKR